MKKPIKQKNKHMQLSKVLLQITLTIGLLLSLPTLVFAQQFPDSLADNSKVELRTFDETTMQDYRKDSDFSYEKVTEVETYSIWDQIVEFLAKVFADSGNRAVIEILMYVITGAIMLFVVLRLLGISPRQLFYGKPADNIVKTSVLEDDIHGINFKQKIAQAESQNDWKEAIRLHYLSVLKIISDRGLIAWKINKTNHDYEIEIQHETLKQPFHQVTEVYEHVCYGSFRIDENHYQRFKGQFGELAKQVV